MDVTPPSCALISCSVDFRPWRWRWYLLSKRRFIYGLHGAVSQKMATFITTAVRTSNPISLLLQFPYPICLSWLTFYLSNNNFHWTHSFTLKIIHAHTTDYITYRHSIIMIQETRKERKGSSHLLYKSINPTAAQWLGLTRNISMKQLAPRYMSFS
jgi:hypothetical protein